MSIIRHRQRVITALSPHQGNRRFIVPKRSAAAPVVTRYTGTLIVGQSGGSPGYLGGLFGSLSPDDGMMANGYDIDKILTLTASGLFQFGILPPNEPNSSTIMDQVNLIGVFSNGFANKVFTRATASFNPSATGRTQWSWSNTGLLVDGNSYALIVDWIPA